jgi:hypothetical protein
MARVGQLGAWALARFALGVPLFAIFSALGTGDLALIPVLAVFWALLGIPLCLLMIPLTLFAFLAMRCMPALDRSWYGISACCAAIGVLAALAHVAIASLPSGVTLGSFFLAEWAAVGSGLALARRLFRSLRPGAFTLRSPMEH